VAKKRGLVATKVWWQGKNFDGKSRFLVAICVHIAESVATNNCHEMSPSSPITSPLHGLRPVCRKDRSVRASSRRATCRVSISPYITQGTGPSKFHCSQVYLSTRHGFSSPLVPLVIIPSRLDPLQVFPTPRPFCINTGITHDPSRSVDNN